MLGGRDDSWACLRLSCGIGFANKPSLSRLLGVETTLLGPGEMLLPWPEMLVSELMPRE
jgi:hypothetical protein